MITTYILNAKKHSGITVGSGIQFSICDTEAERLSGADVAEGDMCYTKDTNKFWVYDGADWLDTAGAGGGGADIKTGTVTIQENGTAVITFATAFSAIPVVVANVQDAGGESNNVQIDAVSTTGATLKLEKVGGGAASSYNVGWVATDAGNS